MLDSVKGYDICFNYECKRIHVNSKTVLQVEKIEKLTQLGLNVICNDDQCLIYCNRTKQIFWDSFEYTDVNVQGLFDPTWDFSQLKYFNAYFAGRSLDPYDFSGFNVQNAEELGFLFYRTFGNTLDLSNLVVNNVNDFTNMFDESEFQMLRLNNWDMRSAKYLVGMFEDSRIRNIDMKGWKNVHPISVDETFSCCAVENLVIDGWDFSRCKESYCFIESCYNLKTVVFKNCIFGGCKFLKLFDECRELKFVNFENCDRKLEW